MKVRVGTSGFSYKEWKGSFYPEDLSQKKMLRYYAERFETVEINATFYRTPKPSLFEGWVKEVAGIADFAFVLKAPLWVTHLRMIEDRLDAVRGFFEIARALGPRLGPVLLHLPPYLEKDTGKLRAFFDAVPKGRRIALEVGNDAWLADDVYRTLADYGHALAIVDDPKKRVPLVATSSWGYVRLREVAYTKKKLDAWVARMLDEKKWKESWVFFKHEDAGTGPRLGKTFKQLLAARTKTG